MRPVEESLREYGRGVIGGMIFSLPLLYTMEVWWAGFSLGSGRLLLLLGLTFLILLGYNTYAGVRPDETWAGVVIDSIEELGLGLLVSAAFLFLLGRIVSGDSMREVMGKVVLEALLIAIGISIGTAQMINGNDEEGEGKARGARPKDLLGVLSLSACGAVVLATNIAITDEIVVIGLESSSWQLIGMMVISLVLGALIMVFSDLLDRRSCPTVSSYFKLVYGSVISYAVAFCCAAIILSLFGRFEGVAVAGCLAMTVVLALPASMGAAAGKLLIQ